MKTRNSQRGYFDFVDIMFTVMICFLIVLFGSLIGTVIEKTSRPLKANTVNVQSIECDPVTVDSVPPYNCTLTISVEDQYLRDTFEANGYVQSLEYGQHKVDDPYPTRPEEDVEDEASGGSLTITVTKDEE